MPLSEHEQRLLEQMEKALYAEDPKFATSLRSANTRRGSRGRAGLGVLLVLVGLGVVVAGVATSLVALGVAGFTAMLVGAAVAYAALQARPVTDDTATDESEAGGASSAPPGRGANRSGRSRSNGGSFMGRMEERWRRRQEGP